MLTPQILAPHIGGDLAVEIVQVGAEVEVRCASYRSIEIARMRLLHPALRAVFEADKICFGRPYSFRVRRRA